MQFFVPVIISFWLSTPINSILLIIHFITEWDGSLWRDRMVVGYTTTCAISAYHHKKCEFEPRSLRGVLDTTLCDKVF